MRDDRGSTTGEFVVLFPVLMVLLLLIVHLGRVTHAGSVIQEVADVAAREASLSSRSSTLLVATSTSRRELIRKKIHCEKARVTTQEIATQGLAAVKVHVACVSPMSQFVLLRLASVTLSASSVSVMDRYRAD